MGGVWVKETMKVSSSGVRKFVNSDEEKGRQRKNCLPASSNPNMGKYKDKKERQWNQLVLVSYLSHLLQELENGRNKGKVVSAIVLVVVWGLVRLDELVSDNPDRRVPHLMDSEKVESMGNLELAIHKGKTEKLNQRWGSAIAKSPQAINATNKDPRTVG
ncbi:hypothetical protein DFH28DRAFT_923781 [Melampsora americana]|nr:hypothetical protein DFH28DRAFT_923781 [Melampsora americana]